MPSLSWISILFIHCYANSKLHLNIVNQGIMQYENIIYYLVKVIQRKAFTAIVFLSNFKLLASKSRCFSSCRNRVCVWVCHHFTISDYYACIVKVAEDLYILLNFLRWQSSNPFSLWEYFIARNSSHYKTLIGSYLNNAEDLPMSFELAFWLSYRYRKLMRKHCCTILIIVIKSIDSFGLC